MRGMTFDEVALGASFEGPEMRVRREDFDLFGRLTRDTAPIHHDDAYAAGTEFGGVIAHGLYGLSLMAGLKAELGLHGANAIASLGWDKVRFARPIYPDARVHVRVAVMEKRPSRKPARGILRYRVELLDEGNDCLVEGEHVLLVARDAVPAGAVSASLQG